MTTTSARSRVRRPGTAVVVAAALVAGVLLGGGPAGAAPDSASAAAQATRLAAQVAELQNRTEAATEQYDAVTADLAGVVTESIQAGARIDALSTEAADSQAAATNRVSALYMSGGDLSLYATVLDGTSPNDLLDRLTTVEDLVGQDRTQVIGLTQQVAAAAATQSRLAALAAHRITLEKQAQAARAVVVGLLARSQQALASANAEVVALVAQEQAATEAAAEAQARAASAPTTPSPTSVTPTRTRRPPSRRPGPASATRTCGARPARKASTAAGWSSGPTRRPGSA